jgi:hypothetical protein
MAVAGAIASAGAINGALFMVLFGLGTVPAMFLVAFSSQFFVSAAHRLRKGGSGPDVYDRGHSGDQGDEPWYPIMSPKFDGKGQ